MERPVDTDASDVNIDEWNLAHSGFTPDVVEACPSPSDVRDWNEEADA